jgi:ribosomal protein S18 acetylase RimI-like enzyme
VTASVTIAPLHESQIEAAGEALGRAFFDDPLQTYLLPNDEDRRRLSAPIFSRLIRYGYLFGEVLTTPDSAGAAVWLPPGEWEMTGERMRAAGIFEIPSIAGDGPFERFGAVMAFLEQFHHRDVVPQHWYLAVIGVDTARQGQGVGRALMKPVIDRADGARLHCYLETANEKNVPFYQSQGFEVMADTVDPTSRLRLWTFRRAPRRTHS